ncbi:MAG: hypothetical protein HXY34_12630 [Candidatus Thorarchaeota archaeon]|nr:hypothetical protein [Candidatus Thorarchaeota archaeon]
MKFFCPVCKDEVEVQIETVRVMHSPRNPVPVVVTHGSPEHAVTVFVDREFRVRATSASDIVKRIATTEAKRKPLTTRHVPFPKGEQVTLSGLDSHQISIVALADGKRSIEELASILELPEMRVKILCEQLVRLGKLESVRVVME